MRIKRYGVTHEWVSITWIEIRCMQWHCLGCVWDFKILFAEILLPPDNVPDHPGPGLGSDHVSWQRERSHQVHPRQVRVHLLISQSCFLLSWFLWFFIVSSLFPSLSFEITNMSLLCLYSFFPCPRYILIKTHFTNQLETLYTVHSPYIITNSLGPVILLCYVKIVLYLGCKNNKIQRNF